MVAYPGATEAYIGATLAYYVAENSDPGAMEALCVNLEGSSGAIVGLQCEHQCLQCEHHCLRCEHQCLQRELGW